MNSVKVWTVNPMKITFKSDLIKSKKILERTDNKKYYIKYLLNKGLIKVIF